MMACSNIGSAFVRLASIPREWRSRRLPDPGRRLAVHYIHKGLALYSRCLHPLRQVDTKVEIQPSAFQSAAAFKTQIDTKPRPSDDKKSDVEAQGVAG